MRLRHPSVVVVLSLALSAPLFAAKKDVQKPAETAASVEATAPAAETQLAARDPLTGQLREPSATEIKALTNEMEKLTGKNNSEEIAVEQKPDGSLEADLGGNFMNVFLARMEADGSVSYSCVNDATSAVSFMLRVDRPATKPAREKE